jgi:hypothetical protein
LSRAVALRRAFSQDYILPGAQEQERVLPHRRLTVPGSAAHSAPFGRLFSGRDNAATREYGYGRDRAGRLQQDSWRPPT